MNQTVKGTYDILPDQFEKEEDSKACLKMWLNLMAID